MDKKKKWFDIKIEAMIPATLTYRIFAEDEHEAMKLIKNKQPDNVKYRLLGRKELKIMVFDSGSNLMRFVKNLFWR